MTFSTVGYEMYTIQGVTERMLGSKRFHMFQMLQIDQAMDDL